MRYFLDTEFYEDGQTITPISLALVRENGSSLYVEFPFDRTKIPSDHFVTKHVLPHLRAPEWPPGKVYVELREVGSEDWSDFVSYKPHVRSGNDLGGIVDRSFDLRGFLETFVGQDAEFWAYYADYDWIVLCQIYGTMVKLPMGFPRYCMDLQQWYAQLGRPKDAKPPKPDGEHDALEDARWNREFHRRLTAIISGAPVSKDSGRPFFGWWCPRCGALNLRMYGHPGSKLYDQGPHPDAWQFPTLVDEAVDWAQCALEAAERGEPIDLRDNLSNFRAILRLARGNAGDSVPCGEISPGDRPPSPG